MRVDARKFADWLVEAEFKPRSYSGRFMYGKRCVSVTVERVTALSVGAKVAYAALTGAGNLNGAEAAVERVIQVMEDARQDSMGLDVVVYWPDLEWTDELEAMYGGESEDEE